MSEAEWSTLIEECRTSGMSIKLWCEKHGITYSRYNYWVKKLQHQPQQWAQVTVPLREATSNEIKLHCGKWTIAIGDDISLKLLADVLRVVDTVCC